MAAILGRGALMAANAAKGVNWSQVGERALSFAKGNSPDVVAKAQAYIAKSTGGTKTLEQLANSRSPVTQSAVVKALFESGLPAINFHEVASLTPEEAKQYAVMIADYRKLQHASVDANQAARPTTSDAFLDRLAVNIDIKKMLVMLGISSEEYALLLRCVNSHTSHDVEVFQLDRVARSERFM